MLTQYYSQKGYAESQTGQLVNVAQYLRGLNAFDGTGGDGMSDFLSEHTLVQDYWVNQFNTSTFGPYWLNLMDQYGSGAETAIVNDRNAPVSHDVHAARIYDGYSNVLTDAGVSEYALIYDGVDPAYNNAIQELYQPYWEMNILLSYIADKQLSESGFRDVADTFYNQGYQAAINQLGVSLPSADQELQGIMGEQASFLSLSPDDRVAYSLVENREDQFDLALLPADERSAALAGLAKQDTAAYVSGSLGSEDAYEDDGRLGVGDGQSYASLASAMQDRYEDYGQALRAQDRNGATEFLETFESQTTYHQYAALDDVIDPVIRLYTGILGRSADADGAEYWVEKNAAGYDLANLAESFVYSAEFQDKVGDMTTKNVVNALYENVLGRSADQAGYDYWVEQVDSGRVTIGKMALSFTESDEYVAQSAQLVQASKIANWGVNLHGFDPEAMGIDVTGSADQADTIIRVYSGLLGRDPDQDGFDFWINEADQGRDMTDLASAFVYSDEFLDGVDQPNVTQVVDALYHNVLGRDPDQGGYDYWINEGNQGKSFGEMALAFTESGENVDATAAHVAAERDDLWHHGVTGVQVSLEDYILG